MSNSSSSNLSSLPHPNAISREICSRSPEQFLARYGHLYDAGGADWLPFRLWPAQQQTLEALHRDPLLVMLKARQLGFSWLVLGYALWLLLFRPGSTVLLFSRRDDEATDLLDFRLKGMFLRLPAWLSGRATGSAHEWTLSNGSRAMAFPTTGGRSYTASLAVVDEADHVGDLDALLNAVKPTVDAGGKLVLLSTADKSRPESAFKRVYRAARAGLNGYTPVFCGWRAHPGRDDVWYARQQADVYARTGSLDDLHQEYPETEEEALAARTLDKRLPPCWLSQCYQPLPPLRPLPPDAPSLAGLEVYRSPAPGRRYVLGLDPAEGNPTSDDSALEVLDADTGEQVAALAGKYDPSVFGAHGAAVARWYNGAAVLVERNNHGHAVLLWLRDNSVASLLAGHDGKPGWLSTGKGKALLYDATADAFRDGRTVLHGFGTYAQLGSIDGATLRAPDGQHDDRAIAYALACWACRTAVHFTRDALGLGKRIVPRGGEGATTTRPRDWPARE